MMVSGALLQSYAFKKQNGALKIGPMLIGVMIGFVWMAKHNKTTTQSKRYLQCAHVILLNSL
jgi:hypothetical protein